MRLIHGLRMVGRPAGEAGADIGDDAEAHDILMCIGDGKTLDQEHRTRMTDADYSFVDGEHMEQAFADVPEAITKATLKQYRHSSAHTELTEFPDRGHSLTIDSGWHTVAETCLSWLDAQQLDRS